MQARYFKNPFTECDYSEYNRIKNILDPNHEDYTIDAHGNLKVGFSKKHNRTRNMSEHSKILDKFEKKKDDNYNILHNLGLIKKCKTNIKNN